MNTDFITKPVKKHGKIIAWRGATVLSIATLAYQAWGEYQANKEERAKTQLYWSQIATNRAEIYAVKNDLSFVKGQLSILLMDRNHIPANANPLPGGNGWSAPN